MTLTPIGGSKPPAEPLSMNTTLRVLAFLLVVFPTAVSVNVLIWAVALRIMGGGS